MPSSLGGLLVAICAARRGRYDSFLVYRELSCRRFNLVSGEGPSERIVGQGGRQAKK